MSALSVFNFGSTAVRVVAINGDPWFVAKDVFEALDIYWNGERTLDQIQDSWKMGSEIHDSLGRPQNTWVIAEPAVYKIAFRSNKPNAIAFTDRVVEIVTIIRKTGSYSVEQPKQLPPVPSQEEMLEGWLSAVRENKQLKAQNDELAPKAEEYDTFIAQEEGNMTTTALARRLGTIAVRLNNALKDAGVLNKSVKGVVPNKAYAEVLLGYAE